MTKKLDDKTKGLSLYRMTGELDQLINIDDPDQETEFLIAMFSKGIARKAERMGKYLVVLKHQAAVFKAEEQRIQARRKALENKHERLKEYIKTAMLSTGNMKIQAGTFTFTVAKNGGSVDIYDDALIPSEYIDVIQTTTIRKNDVARDLKEGKFIPGADLKEGFSLTIR